MKVRLVKNSAVIEEREMDRVPCAGELVWLTELELYTVVEVFWRPDGHASVLLGNSTK